MQVCLLLEKASTSSMHTYLCLYKCFLSKALLERWHLQNNETQRAAGMQTWTWIKAEQTMTKHKDNSQSIFSFNKTKLGTPSLRHKTCRAELMFFSGTQICQVWHNIPCFHWWCHFSKGNSHLAHYRKVTVFLMLRGCISTSSAKK